MSQKSYVQIGLLLALTASFLCVSCSPDRSSQGYSSVERSAESVRSKLKSYSPQIIHPPPEVCGGEANVESSPSWLGQSTAGNDTAGADKSAAPEATAEAGEDEPRSGPVSVTADGGNWEVRSTGGTMAQVVREMNARTTGRIVAAGTGVRVPLYARVRGSDWSKLLDQLATGVGMQVIEADGVTLVTDAQSAAYVLRQVAMRSGGDAPLEEAFVQVEHLGRTASLLAEFALGCRGSILLLPDREVMLVEDTAENIERVREWARVLDDVESKLDRTYSRDRLERYGVPEPTLATCSLPNAGEYKPVEGHVPMGRLVLERALEDGVDVVAGCGTHKLVASAPEAVPSTVLVQEFLGLEKISERTWVSRDHAQRTRALRRAARTEDTWRVVRHEPLSDELGMLLTHRHGGQFQTRGLGWGSKNLLSVRKGHMDEIQATIAEYAALGEEE